MKYYEVSFNIKAPTAVMQDARDIVSALAGEAGFETFEDTDEGVKGYVKQELFDRQVLDALLGGVPIDGVKVRYEVAEAEDRDWNEQWEQEGFEPVVVKSDVSRRADSGNCPEQDKTVIIHDGRHLPNETDVFGLPIYIEIDAHLAFGTGNHETTRMMVATLLHCPLDGKRVLDCGTGTGILAIAALKLGAKEAVGYDIDEWSADNATHNAVINQVDSHFTSLLGDVSVLDKVEGTFDIIMANINRNILLADMPMMRRKMASGGVLLLSGFYTADVTLLTEKAKELGLKLEKKREESDWASLVLSEGQ